MGYKKGDGMIDRPGDLGWPNDIGGAGDSIKGVGES